MTMLAPAGNEASQLEARSRIYKILTEALQYPSGGVMHTAAELIRKELPSAVRALPRGYRLKRGLQQLIRSLPTREVEVLSLQRQYNLLFGPGEANVCAPYEPEYYTSNIFARAHQLADIAGFYKAFGLRASSLERPDFIGSELEFMYVVTLSEQLAFHQAHTEHREICRDAATKFLRDHLGRWTSTFSAALARAGGSGYYGTLAAFTSRFVEDECVYLSIRPLRVKSGGPSVSRAEPFACPAAAPE